MYIPDHCRIFAHYARNTRLLVNLAQITKIKSFAASPLSPSSLRSFATDRRRGRVNISTNDKDKG